MDLRKLLKYLVILVILIVAWKEGWPRLQAKLADLGHPGSGTVAGEDEAGRCVREATTAASDFGNGVSQYARDRSDTGGWRIQNQVQSARGLCRCPGEACDKATEALDQLDDLIQRTDGLVRGSTDVMFNPATDMEQIYHTLEEADAAH
jgi:hypothetical protein